MARTSADTIRSVRTPEGATTAPAPEGIALRAWVAPALVRSQKLILPLQPDILSCSAAKRQPASLTSF